LDFNNSGSGAPRNSISQNASNPTNADRENLPDVLRNPSENNVTTRGNNDDEYTAAQLFAKFSDTVVGIKLGHSRETTGIVGSGVVISEEGFILTCEHVIRDADKVIVVLDDYDDPTVKHEFEATVFGADRATDLAVIKIEGDKPFKYAAIGGSSNLVPGQIVVAIGNPVGLEKTITQGIISGLQRDIDENNAYMLPSIQTDAALNPGNSGGPLFDMHGNVVGIVNIKLVSTSLDNLGFAISIDEALPIIEDLAKNGNVTTRPMLGITAREISPWDTSTSVDEGLVVETVRPGTPAAESGLSRGDIIVRVDGESVASIADIQNVIKHKGVGDEVELTVIRYNNYGERSRFRLKFGLTTAG
jgi:serine protease Do